METNGKSNRSSQQNSRDPYFENGAGVNVEDSSSSTRDSYVRYSIPSWIHIVFGILIFILGVFDLGWTVVKYGSDCIDRIASDDYYECDGTHTYTYVAAPVWGSVFMVMCGVCGVWMSPLKLTHSTWVFYAFLGLSILNGLIISPGIIALQVLEIHFGKGHFYVDKPHEPLNAKDNVKFGMPSILISLGVLEFILSLITVMIACCCPPAAMGGDSVFGFRSKKEAPYPDFGISASEYNAGLDDDDYSDTSEESSRRRLSKNNPLYLPRVHNYRRNTSSGRSVPDGQHTESTDVRF